MSIEGSVVVAGSFAYFGELNRHAGELAEGGFTVLAPEPANLVNPGGSFAYLDTDNPRLSPFELELGYMQRIIRADLLVVANPPAGRIGLSAAAEMACAAIHGVPVVTTCTPPLWDYPDFWFSDEVRPEEQLALDKVPRGIRFNTYASPLILRNYEHVRPVPSHTEDGQVNPDYTVLKGLYHRLLASLPMTPQNPHAA